MNPVYRVDNLDEMNQFLNVMWNRSTMPTAKKKEETSFKSLLCAKLNEPSSLVRTWVQNSGTALIPIPTGFRAFHGAPTGAGDISGYIIGPGTHLEIECKSFKGTKRKGQKRRGAQLTAAGCAHFHFVGPEHERDLKQAVNDAYEVVQKYARLRRENDSVKVAQEWKNLQSKKSATA